MSTLATWDKITGALGSTTSSFGGEWGNLISDFLNGVDIGLVDPNKRPRPNTLTRFKNGKLGIFDSDETHYITFSVDDIDTGSSRNIIIRRMTSPYETDHMMLERLPQEMFSKTINSDNNVITNIVNNNIKSTAAIDTSKLADSNNFLLTTNSKQMTNKIIDFRQNTLLKFARLGAYCSSTFNQNGTNPQSTWGVLRGMVGVGIPSGINMTTNLGIYDIWKTYGTVIDDVAGVVKLDTYISTRSMSPVIRFAFRFNPNTSNNRRMFMGWGAQRMLSANTNTEPLLSSESGFLFGHGAADSVFSIFNNDGSGTCVKTATSVNLPASATDYILEISATDLSGGSFTWTLYNVTANTIRDSMVTNGTGTVTTRIPGSTTGLYIQNLVMGSTTTQQSNEIGFIEVY